MSRPKPMGRIRARVTRAWERVFGTSPPATPPLQKPPSPILLSSASPSKIAISPAPGASQKQSTSLLSGVSPASSPAVIPQQLSHLPTTPSITPPASQILASSQSGVAWEGLRATLRGLHRSANVFPPLQSAIGGLVSCIETIEGFSKNKKEYETMALELQFLSESLSEHLKTSQSAAMSDFIIKMAQLIQEQVDLINDKQARSRTQRLLEVEQDEEAVMNYYHQIRGLLRNIQVHAELSVWSILNEQLANQRLEGLNPMMLAAHDSSLSITTSRRACTEQTRTDVLSALDDWSADPDSPNVYWMNGLAGTGKTTIAYTFAESLKTHTLLAASFFCTRTVAECRDVTRLMPTLAYQLARYSTPFRSALCRVLGDDPDLASRTVSTQFQRLVREPLMEIKAVIPGGLIVIIDGLDEFSTGRGVEIVLDILLQGTSDLPLKFLVTSRPEPIIRDKIENQPAGSLTIGVLHEVEPLVIRADIELYLKEELPSLTQSQATRLAERSGSLFIYAATTVRYLRSGDAFGDFEEYLEVMLSVNPASVTTPAEIDQLYMTILLAVDEKMIEKDTRERMRLVLWTAICARAPVSVETLAVLAGVDNPKKARVMLRHLHSVLYIAKQDDMVSPVHASFSDFILDQSRSGAFFCDSRQHNWLLTRQCFRLMKDQLRFNVCGLETSYQADEQVPRLEERIDKQISPTTSYVCRYWSDHLSQSCDSNNLHDLLEMFLSEHLLFWMEVMNLKHWMSRSPRIILEAKQWLMTNDPSSELLVFVEDARSFVTSFAANAISKSTPHIYVSALPLCHRSSNVYKHYWKRTCGLVEPKGIGAEQRYETILASWTISSPVNSVAYSCDGTQVAIGCKNGSIVIKDAYDGTIIGDPLEVHSGSVNSVAFSPNGMNIVSGSADHTLCFWKMGDDAPTRVMLHGHTDAVRSVVFSYDGTRIASGSTDCTLRLWKVVDEGFSSTPFKGHVSPVLSVAFSPDGKYVASGSGDRTVRVWNVRDETLYGTLKGHTNIVTSVAFSPDGARIVSGSSDRTIRIWDAYNNTLIHAPLTGHINWVTSVAFSPDGTRIISGSYDHTIRIWDPQSGKVMGTPFEGHTNRITSVGYSPDSTRIVSGSLDHTVRIWNAKDETLAGGTFQSHSRNLTSLALSPNGALIVSGHGSPGYTLRVWDVKDGSLSRTPFKGHTRAVISVAFSCDSTRIVSGSYDLTVRVWNVQDGSPVGVPFEGHSEWIGSVAFSPDGTSVASGSKDCSLRIWNLQDGASILYHGHTSEVLSIAFSPDGTRLVSGSGNSIRIWNVKDGSLLKSPFEVNDGLVTSVAFLPDGDRIVSGSSDSSVRVWDVQGGSSVPASFQGHSNWVKSVAVSPNGTHVASGSWDRTIRVWNVRDGAPIIEPFQGHTGQIWAVAFTPDGKHIVSGSNDSSIRIWKIGGEKSPIGAWTLDDDGWIIGDNSQRLFWLPPDMSRCLPTPNNPWSVGPYGTMYADYNGLLLGDQWHKCYLSV